MTAPLHFSSGAAVAQNQCAAGSSALKGKPSGAKRATAALPEAQQQQAGVAPYRSEPRKSIKGNTSMHEGKYLVVQIDMTKHPSQIESAHHTGDGVLFPVSCDGHYGTIEAANSVATYLTEKDPALLTYVVQIISQAKA